MEREQRANTGDRRVEPAPPEEVEHRRQEQAHQMDALGGHPTVPALPRQMFSGMVKGAFIGALIGAVLLTPVAFFPILDLSFITRLLVVWLGGALAGAAAGSVFLAGAKTEGSNRENDEYVYAEGPGERTDGPGGLHR